MNTHPFGFGQRCRRFTNPSIRELAIARGQFLTSDDVGDIAGDGHRTAEEVLDDLAHFRVRLDADDLAWRHRAVQWYASTRDVRILDTVLIHHARYPWAVSRLEAVSADGTTGMICGLGWEWSGVSSDDLAELALRRSLWDMAITGLSRIDVVHLVGRVGRAPALAVTSVRRPRGYDLEQDNALLHTIKAWRWAHQVGDDAPVLPQPARTSQIRRASEREQELLERIDVAAREAYRTRRAHETLLRELAVEMGEARGVIASGHKALWQQQLTTDDIDVEALQLDHPEVYADVRRRRHKGRGKRHLSTFITGRSR